MPIQPSPIADTVGPLGPSVRCFIGVLLATRFKWTITARNHRTSRQDTLWMCFGVAGARGLWESAAPRVDQRRGRVVSGSTARTNPAAARAPHPTPEQPAH